MLIETLSILGCWFTLVGGYYIGEEWYSEDIRDYPELAPKLPFRVIVGCLLLVLFSLGAFIMGACVYGVYNAWHWIFSYILK